MALEDLDFRFARRLRIPADVGRPLLASPALLIFGGLLLFGLTHYGVFGQDCDDPPSVGNSNVFYQNETVGNSTLKTVSFYCISGHKISGPGYIRALCNGTGDWDLNEESAPWKSCRESTLSLGCRVMNATNITQVSVNLLTTPSENMAECVQVCRDANYLYMARQGWNCYCFESLRLLDPPQVDDTECSDLCYDNKSYCGGHSNVTFYSVYTTIHPMVHIDHVVDNYVYYAGMETKENCVQYCKGKSSILSFTLNMLCFCFDQIPEYTAKFTIETYTNYTGQLQITDAAPLLSTTCIALFHQGMFYHGNYIFGNGMNTTCHFYDNSAVCDQGWFAHDGGCYHFTKKQQNATGHFETCKSEDSLLVSIGDQDELNFLQYVTYVLRVVMRSLLGHLLGLVDTTNQFSYMWADETQVAFRPFQQGFPNNISNACTMLVFNTRTIRNVHCVDAQVHAVCEKRSSTIGCARLTVGSVLSEPVINSDAMVTSMCFETCRSFNRKYSITSDADCHCYDDIEDFELVSWDECDISCSVHPFQMCGGRDGAVFITEDVGQPYRLTCDQMILEGMLTNVTLQNGNDLSVMDCKERAGETCDLSWLDIDGMCYRFFPEYNAQAPLTCSSMGGYLSVFETSEEKASVISTLGTIPSLIKEDATWATGLYFLRSHSSRARYTNGAWVDPSLQEYAATASADCSVFRFPSGAQLPEGGVCGENPFICEKSSDYMGCFNVSENNKAAAVISGYPEMTIRLCMEACKPKGHNYAGLFGSDTCLCIDEMALAPINTKCTDLCAGMQTCGANLTDFMSVYRIDYTFNASTCVDLFHQGVLLSGYYTLGEGRNTWCGMINSSFLANYAETSVLRGEPIDYANHRVGEGDKLLSLEIKPSVNKTVDPRMACQGIYEPISIVASSTTPAINHLISEVLLWSMDPVESVPALIGAVDPFGTGSYTWSNGDLFRPWEYNVTREVYLYNQTRSGYLVMDYSGVLGVRDWEEHYHGTCARDSTYKACYKAIDMEAITSSTSARVKDYQSVSTVLCRQACQAVAATHFLMSTHSCLCHNSANPADTVLSGMELVFSNLTECNIGCPAHPYQFCGSPPYFRYHEIESQEEAASCEELYDNFVVYNTTYKVNGADTRCGLDDKTVSCPPGFISKNHRCYAFQRREDTTFPWASNVCFSRSSFLASPTTVGEIESMTNLIQEFTQLRSAELWLVGYYVTFQLGYWTSSLGYMLHQEHPLSSSMGHDDNEEDVFNRCVALNTTSKTLVSVSCDMKLPFICESNSPYLGCAQIGDSSNVTSSLELPTTMSLQQCVSFCYGNVKNLSIVAVHNTTCHCLSSLDKIPNLQSAEKCEVPRTRCPSQAHQMCGDLPNTLEDQYFSVYDIDEMPEEFLVHSCDELFSFGVTLPALYLTKREHDGAEERIRCFKYSPKSNYILMYSPALDITTSTSETEYLATDLILNAYEFKGWKGQAITDSSFVDIDLQEYYLLEGLILIDPSPTETPQVLQISVSLDKEHETPLHEITLQPSKNVTWHYLPVPMVLRHFRLSFNQTDHPRLSLELIGYLYTQHNFHYSYLGCHKPTNMTSSMSPIAVPTLEICRQECSNNGYPLLTIYHPNLCHCVRVDDLRDLYEVDHCNMSCWGQSCDDQGSDDTTRAIYTAIDLVCPRFNVNNSALTETPVVVGHLDDVTIATSLEIDCNPGYELRYASTSVASITTMCHNRLTWSPDITGLNCERLNCTAPPTHPEATITFTNGTKFNDVAVYSCGPNPGIIFDGQHDNWTAVCGPDKTWGQSIPPCSGRLCDPPPTVTLATSNADSQSTLVFEDIVTFTCTDGAIFPIANSTTVNSTCLEDGQWSALETACMRFQCPVSLPTVLESLLTHNTSHGVYTCRHDYTFSDRTDSQAVFCSNDTGLIWTETVSNCTPAVSRDSPWSLYSVRYRLTVQPAVTKSVPSVTACALGCLTDYNCLKFSYTDTHNVGNCVLSMDGDASITHSSDGDVETGWSTYYMGLPT